MNRSRMLFAEGPQDAPPSRREFLARLAITITAPALARCGSNSEAAARTVDAKNTAARAPLPRREPLMRVRVLRARSPDATVTLGAERQWIRLGPASADAAEFVLRGPLRIGIADTRWSVVDANDVRAPVVGLETLELAVMGDDASPLVLGNRTYPGTMRVVTRADQGDGAFDIVNLVPMETYLPGVVAAELFNHWRLETRAAQAIAARSFGASEHAYFRGRRAHDVTNTAHSQVYRGQVKHGDSHEAVETTRGVVLAFEKRLVPGYYSACCGGTPACGVDAIGRNPINDIAPLRGHDGEDVCTDVKIARWTIERNVPELSRRFASWGRRRRHQALSGLGEIASIETVARNEHGRPTRYGVTDTRGETVELAAEKLRAAANHSAETLAAPRRRLLSSHLAATIDGGTADFAGRGHGHGVGMCQYGAETLARDGTGHQKILDWYYPGAQLRRAYT